MAQNAAELALAAYPGLRRGVQAQRAFLASAVRYLVSARSATPTTLRGRGEVNRFFDGLELLEPGVVQVHRWRPGSVAPDGGEQVAGRAGLARKR